MIEYRHLTNLQQPFDPVDQRFLDTIADYRIGQPTIAKRKPGKPVSSYEKLRESNIVGIYTTEAALKKPEVKKLTGWYETPRLTDLYKPLEEDGND